MDFLEGPLAAIGLTPGDGWWAIIVAAALLLLLLWLLRTLAKRGPRIGSRKGAQSRLAVVDAAIVTEGRGGEGRRLVLVRRDDVEHLLMIGGATDLVIESDIGGERKSAAMSAPTSLSAAESGVASSPTPSRPRVVAQDPDPAPRIAPSPPKGPPVAAKAEPQQAPRIERVPPSEPVAPPPAPTAPPVAAAPARQEPRFGNGQATPPPQTESPIGRPDVLSTAAGLGTGAVGMLRTVSASDGDTGWQATEVPTSPPPPSQPVEKKEISVADPVLEVVPSDPAVEESAPSQEPSVMPVAPPIQQPEEPSSRDDLRAEMDELLRSMRGNPPRET